LQEGTEAFLVQLFECRCALILDDRLLTISSDSSQCNSC
jgi:hypothetical protein